MAAVNTVTIEGNIVSDLELRFSNKGNAHMKFPVAWNSNKRLPDGTWESEGHFFDVVCFGELAEHLAETAKKGTSVTVSGRLTQAKWQDKETGGNRSKVEIIADNVAVSLRWQTCQGVNKPGKSEGSSGVAAAKALVGNVVDEDEMPF